MKISIQITGAPKKTRAAKVVAERISKAIDFYMAQNPKLKVSDAIGGLLINLEALQLLLAMDEVRQ